MSSTILKGLRVIEYLAYAKGPRGISQIAREIDMNKSAVQRILNTLVDADYVERAHATSKYQLTLSIWEIGSHVVERHEVRRLLHPILRFAAQTTGFTAFSAYLSFPFVVYLDKVEGAHGRTHTTEPGRRIPLHRTASGKAVLAFLPPDELADLAREQVDWSGHVTSEAIDPSRLEDEMRRVRERRYAVSEGGLTRGVNSIAAPVWWRSTRPYGSIVLTADERSLPRAEFEAIGERLVKMAQEATVALGGLEVQGRAVADGADERRAQGV